MTLQNSYVFVFAAILYMCHFTDPLTCSFLILSFSVTPHIHPIILISFTSSLLSSRFVVAHVSPPALLSISSCCTHPMSYLHTNTSVHLNHRTRSCSPFSTESPPALFPCVSFCRTPSFTSTQDHIVCKHHSPLPL